MRIPIAKDGYRFIVPLAIVTAVAFLAKMPCVGTFFLFGLLFVVNFFRDPERSIPQEKNVVVSPADGKVVEIVDEENPLLGEMATRVSIFLNVFNVHVNRVPVAGEIESIHYNKGKFLNAASHKASLDNEQNCLIISTGKERILVKQIAGLIARRIVCWVEPGQKLEAGERFGLIRFGSRADLFLPLGSKIEVKVGDKVSGGSSIVAYLQENN